MKFLKPAIYLILSILLTALIPFSGIAMPIFFILSSAFFVALAVKWNYVYTAFSFAFSGILIYLLSGLFMEPVTSLIFATLFPLVALISATGIYLPLRAGHSLKTVLLGGTLGYFLIIAVVCIVFGGSFIADILTFAQNFMIESLESIAASVPSYPETSITEMKKMYEHYFETLKVVAPSIIISLFFLISFFTIKVAEKFSKKHNFFKIVPPFSEIRAPRFFILITALSYAGQLAQTPFLSGLSANLFMCLTVYYTLCGFSVIDFFVKKRIRKGFLRFSVYIIAGIILTVLSVALYFLNPVLIAMFGGMLDSMFDYRSKLKISDGK